MFLAPKSLIPVYAFLGSCALAPLWHKEYNHYRSCAHINIALVGFLCVFPLIHQALRFNWFHCVISLLSRRLREIHRVYPIKYAHGFVMLCFFVFVFVVSFAEFTIEIEITNFAKNKALFQMGKYTHILPGCFGGTRAIIWLPQCHWSNPEG